jgi:hypothetical protein
VKRAAQKGLPRLLLVAAKANGPVKRAFITWSKTAEELGASATDVAGQLGNQAVCVGGQLTAAAAMIGSIKVNIDVSVEASAEVGGACGASAG